MNRKERNKRKMHNRALIKRVVLRASNAPVFEIYKEAEMLMSEIIKSAAIPAAFLRQKEK